VVQRRRALLPLLGRESSGDFVENRGERDRQKRLIRVSRARFPTVDPYFSFSVFRTGIGGYPGDFALVPGELFTVRVTKTDRGGKDNGGPVSCGDRGEGPV